MWDALSGIAFSLWGVLALGFAVFFGAIVWQLMKIACGGPGPRSHRGPWGIDEQAEATLEDQV
jgi:hypothetical protein